MTAQTDLIAFLSESAQEAAAADRHDEAQELLALRGRVIARQFEANQLKLPLELKQAA